MDDERKEYLRQYKKDNLKRVVLNVKGDDYDKIKLAADMEGASVSRYIKSLIEKDIKAKQGTAVYRIALQRKNQDGSSPDYFKSPPKQELEKVIFDSYDVACRYTGKAVALLTPEEAAKYREAQKEKAAEDKT